MSTACTPASVVIDVSAAAGRDASLEDPRDASPRHDATTGLRAVAPAGGHDGSGEALADASALRRCAWCRGPIPARARCDAVCCSQRCRQARHRFTRAVGRGVAAGVSLRLAYADPPYPRNAARYYGEHPDYDGEVDHAALIRRLSTYDGWALSTSAAALPSVLALCPAGVRVAAWVRGERPARSGRPLNAWEPVIYHGGRHLNPWRDAGATRHVDVLVYTARPRLTDPDRVIGAKPATFARWPFDLLGARPGDELHDLYPGSGGITRAWHAYTTDPVAREDQPA
jgi:hypothetical protein